MQVVRRGRKRMNVSLVAFVCDDPALQPFLPQIIIGEKSTCFKQRDIEALIAECPEYFFLLSGKSHWTNTDIMRQITELLSAIVRERCPEAFIIWYLDAAGSHLDRESEPC